MTLRRLIGLILLTSVTTAAVYAIWAFVLWSADPGTWGDQARGSAAIVWACLTLTANVIFWTHS